MLTVGVQYMLVARVQIMLMSGYDGLVYCIVVTVPLLWIGLSSRELCGDDFNPR